MDVVQFVSLTNDLNIRGEVISRSPNIMNIIRASVVQACTAAYSLTDTLDKLERLTRVAKDRDGAQIVVFPEAFLGGYPKMSTFGVVVGDRTQAGRDEFLRYHNAAVDIPSPTISRIEAVSKESGVFLVVGVIERHGGTLYCTVVFIHPEHGYVAKHRKLVPTAMERLLWGQGDGSTLGAVATDFKSSSREGHIVHAKVTATIWRITCHYCGPTITHKEPKYIVHLP